MEQPHHTIAVAHGVGEIILVDGEEPSDRAEHLEAGCVERVVKFKKNIFEAGNFGRPDIVRHHRAELVPGGKLAPDVPEFLEVGRGAALGSFDPKRGVTTRAAATGDEVSAPGLVGQCEKLFGQRLGAVDQILRDAVVADDREAIIDEALAKLLRKGLRVKVGVVERHRCDGIAGENVGHE